MSARGRVFIRADAGGAVGLGHLSRCGTLARQLVADGFDVQFISRADPGLDVAEVVTPLRVISPRPELARDASSAQGRDAESTLAIVSGDERGRAIIIVDNYALDAEWERRVRSAGHLVVAIDDFRDRRHAADILISDSPVSFDPRLNECPTAVLLAGRAYAIIDPAFEPNDEPEPANHDGLRILVSYGGTDPTDETSKALLALRLGRDAGNEAPAHVDIVVGHSSDRLATLTERAHDVPGVEIHHAPRSIAPLLRQAHVVLTAGGHSMIEAVTMQRVTVVTTTADNQALSVAALESDDAIIGLGDHARVDAADVAGALRDIAERWPWHARNAGMLRIFDTHGAARISAAIRSSRESWE